MIAETIPIMVWLQPLVISLIITLWVVGIDDKNTAEYMKGYANVMGD